ncbi:hypothetical protein [Methylobacterium sp. JK268]
MLTPTTTTSTLADLCRAAIVTREQIDAAVADFLTEPTAGPRLVADDVTVDIAAAIEGHPWAHLVAYDPGVSVTARHLAIRTAVLLAVLG